MPERGHMHRILTGNLVGKNGYCKSFPSFPDNIQIWHARLNHHHVCPLLQILGNFMQRFHRICRVHLIVFFVPFAQRHGRLSGFAKRTVIV